MTTRRVLVLGVSYRHCSIHVDPYAHTFELLEQLGGQGYIWELVYGATHEKLGPLFAVRDPSEAGKNLNADEVKASVQMATWARIKEYRSDKSHRLRLDGDFLNRFSYDELRWAENFDVELEKVEHDKEPVRVTDASGAKALHAQNDCLLVLYEDAQGICRRSPHVEKVRWHAEAARLVIVQTDAATNHPVWYPEGSQDGDTTLLEKTLFVTRARVLSDAATRPPGVRTHLSLDTALDDLRQLVEQAEACPESPDPRSRFLRTFRHLLVRLDHHVAVYLSRHNGQTSYSLMFAPKMRHAIAGGYMLGYTTILTACLAREWCGSPILGWSQEWAAGAVEKSFRGAWLHFGRGFRDRKRTPPWADKMGFGRWNTWIFETESEEERKQPARGVRTIDGVLALPPGRTREDLVIIRLRKRQQERLEERQKKGRVAVREAARPPSAEVGFRWIAEEILKKGPVRAFDDEGLPFEQIGNYLLLGSGEIDAYRSLQALLRRHMQDAAAKKPFNIAVFGAPGSGKSFGVSEVAASLKQVGIAEAGPKIELNLSQFRGPKDLCRALHRVRNELLGGSVPLVFFDEFDTSLDGQPYGWLKLFLAPMQDGKFLDGETEFNLGRPIFVFAGGVNQSFKEMSARVRNPDFLAAKGPDFISRLRWHVDISGVERPEDPGAQATSLHELRRAILIRGMLERSKRWQESSDAELPLDEPLTRAFLEVSRFRHGARSIEAILGMSRGEPGRQLRVMDLPPRELLDMHVDAREFLGLSQGSAF